MYEAKRGCHDLTLFERSHIEMPEWLDERRIEMSAKIYSAEDVTIKNTFIAPLIVITPLTTYFAIYRKQTEEVIGKALFKRHRRRPD